MEQNSANVLHQRMNGHFQAIKHKLFSHEAVKATAFNIDRRKITKQCSVTVDSIFNLNGIQDHLKKVATNLWYDTDTIL